MLGYEHAGIKYVTVISVGTWIDGAVVLGRYS